MSGSSERSTLILLATSLIEVGIHKLNGSQHIVVTCASGMEGLRWGAAMWPKSRLWSVLI